jgi:pimeloyl-ACP methyl ester carboxylesterase
VAAFVFIHGAGDAGWYWHLVAAELRERGHHTVAPDLPCDDDSAGLPEYADTVAAAASHRTDLVVVTQSLGGFTAPLVCDRVPVELLVLVAPMIPASGEAPAGYWAHTRYEEEVRGRPDVPTRILICRDDRLFPPGFLRRVARERLGITPDEIDGGHTPALSRPHELADRLEAYAAGQGLIPAARRRPGRPAAGSLAGCRP